VGHGPSKILVGWATMQLAHPIIISPNEDSEVQGDLLKSVNSLVISAVHTDMHDVVDTAAAASLNDSRRTQYGSFTPK